MNNDQPATTPQQFAASVKVMRSYDYCHFEIALSTTQELPLGNVDAMRKEAARLADKAVAQYIAAKKDAAKRAETEMLAAHARHMPESELTPKLKAALKEVDDENWRRSRYDYDDEYF